MRLVIETAGPACSVALLDDAGHSVANGHEIVGRGHAERLIPMIAGLPGGGCAESIWVDCGPGSFTGIRVGVAAARALGLGWGVPVTGFSSLALLAARYFADANADRAAIAIPGGHGQLFVQRFAAAPFRETGPLASLVPADAERFAGFVMADIAGLDARHAAMLDPAFTALAPRPIYGRAPDAQPMA